MTDDTVKSVTVEEETTTELSTIASQAISAVREKLKEMPGLDPESIDNMSDEQVSFLFSEILGKHKKKKEVGKFGYHVGKTKPTLKARKEKYKAQKKNQKLARRKNRVKK